MWRKAKCVGGIVEEEEAGKTERCLPKTVNSSLLTSLC